MRMVLLFLLLLEFGFAKKVALVIGNKHYVNQTGLKNPISDAELIRDILVGMQFEVIEVYDADLDMLDRKLSLFNQKAGQAKIAVVYYAGHGIGVHGKNYIVPIGTRGLSVRNLPRKLLSVDELKEAVAQANGFGLVLLFDACRNSLFNGYIQGLSSRGSRALAQPKVTQKNVLVSFSTQANTIAKDDVNNGNHSPYVMALSQYLKDNRDIRQVMGSVRDRVWSLTSNTQYPIEENMLGGERYCLSGYCEQKIVQVVNDKENRRLRERIAMLERQQQVEVAVHSITVDAKSTLVSKPISTSMWITPTDSVCKANGGKIDEHGVCQANWENSKKICSASGGDIPSKSLCNYSALPKKSI